MEKGRKTFRCYTHYIINLGHRNFFGVLLLEYLKNIYLIYRILELLNTKFFFTILEDS